MKSNLTFITGNSNKVTYVSQWLHQDLAHHKIDLPEIQSTDLRKVATHKAEQAYGIIKKPVLVEDCALLFHAIAPLPGPFVKWFEEASLETMCRMLDGFDDRSITAKIIYCIANGETLHFFEGEMHGTLADHPKGKKGFGFDPVFINQGYSKTRGEMSEEAYQSTSYRYKALSQLSDFLQKYDTPI